MNRWRCKRKYLRENVLAMKSMKNKCNSLCKREKDSISKNTRAKILQITNNSGIYLNLS